VDSDPIALNSRLGVFTNPLNLLDLAAVAAPAGFRADGLPFGITFVGPAFSDQSLLALSAAYLLSLRPPLHRTGGMWSPKPDCSGPELRAGCRLDLEIWDLPVAQFGTFLRDLPSPLTIGTIHLSDGRAVKGFPCEEATLPDATNISTFGAWKAYLRSQTLAAANKNRG